MNHQLSNSTVSRIVFSVLLSLLFGCATDPNNVGKTGVATATATAHQSTQDREANQQEIVRKALATMAASNDPAAIALSAKSVRMAGLEDGKVRTNSEQDKIQAEALRRALTQAEAAVDVAKRVTDLAFVRYVIASHCTALVNEAFCQERNRLYDYTNSHSANAYGWLLFASVEYAQGRNVETQVLVKRAANEPQLDWHYARAVGIGLNYARLVAQGGANNVADAEVAALMIAGELSMPPFQRFSQMCNPDPEGKLPDGRYEACRQLASRMIDSGKSNIEVIVGLRAMERMALGEKKAVEAKMHAERLAKFQEGINALWKTKLKYPPTNAGEADLFASYVNDLIVAGERQATENMKRKFGMSGG